MDTLTINSAITLPVGVEAYAALAMSAWLTSAPVKDSTRAFARASAIGALGLGMVGQVVYHLLEVNKAKAAPWWVVIFVSCLPVLVLGLGAGLAHMIHRDRTSAAETQGRPDAWTSNPPADSAAIPPASMTPLLSDPPALAGLDVPPDHSAADEPGRTSGRLDVPTSTEEVIPPPLAPSGNAGRDEPADDDDPDPDPGGPSQSRRADNDVPADLREEGERLAALRSDAARVRAALAVLGMQAGPADVRAWLGARNVTMNDDYIRTAIKRARKAARDDERPALSLVKEEAQA
ncbi:hypothetical protein [Actinomadura atramentaria]|uniref:hypothetical protein n=1 Tax=Actinomadura atramentaria TaxID=1990 RepID=UPI0012FB6F93|nr:hypothetical protein [Actinomadura atramentaria]